MYSSRDSRFMVPLCSTLLATVHFLTCLFVLKQTRHAMLNSGDIALTVCFSILLLAGLVGNVLVCLVVLLNRSMQTPINYLLVNLAVADIITVTFTSPQYVFIHAFSHPTGMTGDFLCKFITGGNISWIGGVASVFSLVAISFERFQAVTNPYNQTSKFSLSKVKVIVASCWIFTSAFNLPLFFAIYYDKEKKFCLEYWPSPVYGRINSSVWLLTVGIIPAAIMVSLYSRVVYDLWFKNVNETTQVAVRKSRKRVTKVVLIVSVIYAVSWFPQLIVYVLSNFHYNIEFGDFAYIVSVVVVTFNSAVNPVIYAFQSERFRQHFKQLLCCRTKREVAPLVSVAVTQQNRSSNEHQITKDEFLQNSTAKAQEKFVEVENCNQLELAVN